MGRKSGGLILLLVVMYTIAPGQPDYRQYMRLGQWQNAYNQWLIQYHTQPCPSYGFFRDGITLLDTIIRRGLRSGAYPAEKIDTLMSVYKRAKHCLPSLKDSLQLEEFISYWDYKIIAGLEYKLIPTDSVLRAYERLGALAQQNPKLSGLLARMNEIAERNDEAWTLIKEREYFVRQWFQLKNAEGALPHWRLLFRRAPCGSSIILSGGADMLYELLSKAQEEKRKQYTDTLMLVYDIWLRCFPEDSATALPYKLYYAFSLNSFENMEQLYNMAQTIIRLKGNGTEHFVLPIYLYSSINLYKNKSLADKEVLNAYTASLAITRANLQGRYGNYYRQVEAQLHEMFAKSGVIKDCGQLDTLFGFLRTQEQPATELLGTVYQLGDALNCETSFFTWVAEQMWKMAPSADIATELSNLYYKQNQCDRAIEIATKGAELSQDSLAKAKLFHFAAAVASACLKKFPQARELARTAIKWAPAWGEPYILIGDLYASSSKMCEKEGTLDHKAVFWLAIDYYTRAMQIDPSVKERATERIAKYKKYTPTREDAHFYLLKEGDTYRVECWIQESTTVRFYE